MVLPIYAYGQPVLKKRAEEVDPSDERLQEFISNMWDTMYHAGGVGLAAPQVGRSLRIFLVDTAQIEDDENEGIKEVFINPEILEYSEDQGNYEEGCLSIPDVTGDVIRPNKVKVRYLNGDLEEREHWLGEMEARVFQHEFDHVEGVLFVEKLKPLRKKRVQKKLEKIKKGQISAKYKLKFV
jgi:peptide deformylase